MLVGIVFVLGHLFHYALMLAANRILEPGTFGRFYAAISLLNVLLTPVTVLGPGEMEIKGCAVLGLICQAQRWTKVS